MSLQKLLKNPRMIILLGVKKRGENKSQKERRPFQGARFFKYCILYTDLTKALFTY